MRLGACTTGPASVRATYWLQVAYGRRHRHARSSTATFPVVTSAARGPPSPIKHSIVTPAPSLARRDGERGGCACAEISARVCSGERDGVVGAGLNAAHNELVGAARAEVDPARVRAGRAGDRASRENRRIRVEGRSPRRCWSPHRPHRRPVPTSPASLTPVEPPSPAPAPWPPASTPLAASGALPG